ncbi:DUF4012 domain-containing protein [Patescibacteria group bacterium]|nr:DUF4012 domain-containing protein [Patescibacteria group bacterium]MBU0964335.1 DUF4012 domain-containing protein [Patescibacteria group bacterium]
MKKNKRSEKVGKNLNVMAHSLNLRVPEQNILDLRKMEQEKNQKQEQDNQPVMAKRFKGFFKKSDSKLFFFKKKQPIAKETIIVSKPSEIVSNKKASFNQNTLPEIEQDKPVKNAKEKVEKKKEQDQPASSAGYEQIIMGQFELTRGWYKKLLVFVGVCVLVILPVYLVIFYEQAIEAKGRVLGISSEAYKDLKQAGLLAGESEFSLASENFSQATENFVAAQDQLNQVGSVVVNVTKIIPGQAKSAQHLLEAGKSLGQVGSTLTSVISKIDSLSQEADQSDNVSLTEYLTLVRTELNPAMAYLSSAADNLANVRIKDLPEEYQGDIAKAQSLLPQLKNGFANYISLADVMLEVLGHQTPKRYLLIFQNNRELRPTGGFIGSIAMVDINKGVIENLEVPGGGVYDVAGQLNEKIVAPKPLWLVNPHWNIQDANWFFDFPTSAEKIIWFFERAGRTSVEGVISLTPEVIENLFKAVGPVDMLADYGVIVNEENFVREAQYWAEVAYDRDENKPKKFISDLMPKLLNKVFATEPETLLSVLNVFNQSLNNKDFLLYFNDEAVESKINELGWSGSIKETSKDYLSVVATNIAGGKTDHIIDQFVEHQADIQPDGSIINTVTVTRTHTGNSLDFWEGSANVSYLRFYVPKGSEIIEVNGFTDIPSFRYTTPDEDAEQDIDLLEIETSSLIDERSQTRITNESGKTVFGNWLSLDPGETKSASIKYQLPFKIETSGIFKATDTYSLLVQKQPGMANCFFASQVTVDQSYDIIWHPSDLSIENNSVEYISDIDADKYFGFLLSK